MRAIRAFLPILLFDGCSVGTLGAGAAPPAAAARGTDGLAASGSFRADARSIETLINREYAYLDRFSDGKMPMTARLRAEAEAVADKRSLLRYAERALLLLADHHAITGSSLADSWAVVPSYADLWVEKRPNGFIVEAVRDGSPADRAGIRPGDRLTSVDGVATAEAVAGFWADLGASFDDERAGFAARVLAAGRRDRPRRLFVQTAGGETRSLDLASLYQGPPPVLPLVAADRTGAELVIRLNDSLGQDATIAAFDKAMSEARPGQRVVIDLRDTPSGGNTVVARAILGWFVTKAVGYQVHSLPAEARRTGIERQWIEQVLPRPGKYHRGPVQVRVGRWTGSMGEGLAIAFHALGAEVVGGRMAGLLGAVYDHRLDHSDFVLKLPTERLYAVDGTPREAFAPRADEPGTQ